MGDYKSPKRRDVLDRLRRRFEVYRRQQNGVQQRYDFGQKPIIEQEKQHALILHKKWLESKAKKASKSKSKSDNSGSDHRNQNVAVSLPFSFVQITPLRTWSDRSCVHCNTLDA